MNIIADINIPYLPDAMRSLGTVSVFPSKQLTKDTVQNADLLFTRSTVKIGASLLSDSNVRFVATATIGTDHVDFPFLQSKGIRFASAPGSNANSVAEWFVSSLLTVAKRKNFSIQGKVIGVVGVGNVGSKVARNAKALGMEVLLCDPPLARQTNDPSYKPIETLIREADILTFHVPLEKSGTDPTYKMVNGDMISAMKPGVLFINASRGPIVDEPALLAANKKNKFTGMILDVFENEPEVSAEAIALADLASPHVAGHSLDGKANGTEMVYKAACAFLGIEPSWKPADSLPKTPVPCLCVPTEDDMSTILRVMRSLHRVEEDDTFMREIAALPQEERGKRFSSFRNNYRERREATYSRVVLPAPNQFVQHALQQIGFQV